MSFTKEHKVEIINTILRAIKEKKNPYNETLSFYKISRQTVYKYIKELIEKKLIKKVDNKNYTLSFYNLKEENYKNINLQEDIIYKNLLKEVEKDKKENVIHILTYSFTEILNNAIEHSESRNIKISYGEDYFSIYVQILDDGVGIFKKFAAMSTGAETYPPVPITISGLKFLKIFIALLNENMSLIPLFMRLSLDSLLKPLAFINFISNPALGTICASIPFWVPTNKISSSPRFLNSEAIASAGYTCPPVPPPVNTTFIAPP